jgi:hypothetical protein
VTNGGGTARLAGFTSCLACDVNKGGIPVDVVNGEGCEV